MLPRRVLTVLIAGAAAVAALLVAAGPASADPIYVPSSQSGATVNHLRLASRVGYINLKLTAGVGDQIVGLTVSIPAAGGSWQPVASRTFAAAGLTCTSAATAALTYTCHTPIVDNGDGPVAAPVPTGSYQMALPAGRATGATTGITGTVALIRAGTYGSPDWSRAEDTFPVIDATTAASTAETREVDSWNNGTWTLNSGVISVNVLVASGDKVTGLYIDLPQAVGSGWTVQNRSFPNGGRIDCGQDTDYSADPANYVVSCHDYVKPQDAWPAGNYELTLHVANVNDLGTFTGTLELRLFGGRPYPVDTFPIYNHDVRF